MPARAVLLRHVYYKDVYSPSQALILTISRRTLISLMINTLQQ